VPDAYPLPQIKTILKQLHRKTIFTALDIHWGYHNIYIKKEDKWKVAFKTPFGLYKPKVMFFGLQNSPTTFQCFMDNSFANLVNKYPSHILIYMDDILICSDKLQKLHLVTHKVLDQAKQLSLFFKPSKCHFEKDCIQYLGIEIKDGKIFIDPTKKNGLASWPTVLKNVAEVQSTLGVLGYQHPFICSFADIAQPITALLKKGTIFH
jgi:Reverse transcriptase (RNA-dependent DNA polymerase)